MIKEAITKPSGAESVRGEMCYFVRVKSSYLPFVALKRNFKEIDRANANLQKMVRLIEKKFDSIWYIGTDYMGENLEERFIFHHGGFLEISLNGEIRAFFKEDKRESFVKALYFALYKILGKTRSGIIIKEVQKGQRLINLSDSLK